MEMAGVACVADLAPGIHRQRVVVEWTRAGWLGEGPIREFSGVLAAALGMRVIHLAVSRAAGFGLGATCHWDFSGWSLMAWDRPRGVGFAALDLHSCKPYEYGLVAETVAGFWEPRSLVWAPVLPELACR